MEFRESQERLLSIGMHPGGKKYTLGDVTSVNLTMLKVWKRKRRNNHDDFDLHLQSLTNSIFFLFK